MFSKRSLPWGNFATWLGRPCDRNRERRIPHRLTHPVSKIRQSPHYFGKLVCPPQQSHQTRRRVSVTASETCDAHGLVLSQMRTQASFIEDEWEDDRTERIWTQTHPLAQFHSNPNFQDEAIPHKRTPVSVSLKHRLTLLVENSTETTGHVTLDCEYFRSSRFRQLCPRCAQRKCQQLFWQILYLAKGVSRSSNNIKACFACGIFSIVWFLYYETCW